MSTEISDDSNECKLTKNIMGFTSYYAKKLPGTMTVIENDQFVVVDTGLSSSYFNIASSPSEVEVKQVNKICNYFKEQRKPFSWWAKADDPALVGSINKSSLKNEATYVGMNLDFKDFRDERLAKEELVIKRVVNAKVLLDFARVVQHQFIGSVEEKMIIPYYKKVAKLDLSKKSSLVHYLSYKDGEVVSSITTYLSGNVVGLYNLSTYKQYRRKGYGTALVCYALNRARESGATSGVLMSSLSGVGLYKKIGFKELNDVYVYQNRHLI
jgi:GNAT superfamily N-acetyltransferase